MVDYGVLKKSLAARDVKTLAQVANTGRGVGQAPPLSEVDTCGVLSYKSGEKRAARSELSPAILPWFFIYWVPPPPLP